MNEFITFMAILVCYWSLSASETGFIGHHTCRGILTFWLIAIRLEIGIYHLSFQAGPKLDGDQRSAFPNAITREPHISQKFLGNSRSRAFGNILFPVSTQYQHSGLAVSRSCLGLGIIREFPNASRMKIHKLQ